MVKGYAQGPLEDIHAVEPLFTSYDAYEVKVLNKSQEKEEVTNAGSYGFTLSPILFSSHDIPYEIYLNSKNQAIISEY